MEETYNCAYCLEEEYYEDLTFTECCFLYLCEDCLARHDAKFGSH